MQWRGEKDERVREMLTRYSDDKMREVTNELKKELPIEITCEDGREGRIVSIMNSGWVLIEKKGADKNEVRMRRKDLVNVLVRQNRYLVDYVLDYKCEAAKE